jgi:putative SOS response-associated peptidase YedK
MLTTAPGLDIAPIYDRQVVILDRADWATWLDPAAPPEHMLRPSLAEKLIVEGMR